MILLSGLAVGLRVSPLVDWSSWSFQHGTEQGGRLGLWLRGRFTLIGFILIAASIG